MLPPKLLSLALLAAAGCRADASREQQPLLDALFGADGDVGRRKNIVLILSDDQDAVMNSVAYMPQLKEHIIDRGTHFANHFTTTAICCPARVSLWTGKQPHNTNVTDVSPPYGEHAHQLQPRSDFTSEQGHKY